MASPTKSTTDDRRRTADDGAQATDGGVGSAPANPSSVVGSLSSGDGEPAAEAAPREPRAGGLNPIAIMIGVGVLMLAVIAVASALRQPVSDSIQGGARQGTGQLVPSGVSVGEGPKVASLAPVFALTDLNGEAVSLSDLRGRPVML